MKTFLVPTASQLHLIHASSCLCSVSFYTESHQFLQKDNKTDREIALPFIIPSHWAILFVPVRVAGVFQLLN